MKLIFTILSLFVLTAAMSNDGVFYMNGNQLIPVNETQVELKKEILTIKRVGRQIFIDVDYTFYNPGKAKKVLMGFEAPMPQGAANFRYSDWEMTRSHPFLKKFIVEINGKQVPYTSDIVNKEAFEHLGSIEGLTQAELDSINDGKGKEMYFPIREGEIFVNYFENEFQHGITKVHHTYQFPCAYSNDMPLSFDYILTAANRWANEQIDDFTLVIEMRGFYEFYMPQNFFEGVNNWNDAAEFRIVDESNLYHWMEEFIPGALHVRGKGSGKPLIYKQKDFKPKGELSMFSFRDEYDTYEGYYTYAPVFSDTGIFDVAEHKVLYSFYEHSRDLRYAADEFSLQVLRNYPFALRGYPFKNQGLRKYYESLDWYVADPNRTITVKDLKRSELEWINRLSVFDKGKEN